MESTTKNIAYSILIYISFEKLRENVLQILELYLFGSILTDELLEKFIVKIEKAVDSLKNEQTIIAYRFFFMCSLIIKKYENILQIKKFELINQKIIQKFNFQINPEEILRIINQNVESFHKNTIKLEIMPKLSKL